VLVYLTSTPLSPYYCKTAREEEEETNRVQTPRERVSVTPRTGPVAQPFPYNTQPRSIS